MCVWWGGGEGEGGEGYFEQPDISPDDLIL